MNSRTHAIPPVGRRTRLKFLALVAALATLNAIPASAQVTAAISGKVEDASGAGVGSVGITVRSIETGATRNATTDDTGSYRVDSLPLGAIEVRAEKTGFKSRVQTGIDLVVGQDASVNMRLEVGEMS